MCVHLGSKIELGKMASTLYGAQFPMSLDGQIIGSGKFTST